MINRHDRPREEDDFRDLDLTKVQFPSDTITIGLLRKKHPALFDKGFEEGRRAQPQFFFLSDNAGHAEDVLANMLHCERRIAANAYAKAKGLPPLDGDIAEFKEELADLYLRYEITSGRHAAVVLIQDIERQGEELARGKSI